MPAQIYTDRGLNFCRASQNVAEMSENWNWDKIASTTAKTTSWRFTPASSQWRNGMAEARVRAFKEALDHVMPAGAKDLNFAEFDALLKKVSNLVNDRPLGVKRS